MSDTPNNSTTSTSNWVFVVIGLVAIIGLLAGLLISKSTNPTVATTPYTQTSPQIDGPPRGGPKAGPENEVRHILRSVSSERRREILDKASANFGSAEIRPRALIEQRHQARRKVVDLASAETLDQDALRAAMDEMQKINAEIAAHGADLTIEVLKHMTPEERKTAGERRMKNRQERRRKRRDRD